MSQKANQALTGHMTLGQLLKFVLPTIMPIVFYYVYGPDTALLGVWWSVNYAEALALVVTVIFLLTNRKKYQY